MTVSCGLQATAYKLPSYNILYLLWDVLPVGYFSPILWPVPHIAIYWLTQYRLWHVSQLVSPLDPFRVSEPVTSNTTLCPCTYFLSVVSRQNRLPKISLLTTILNLNNWDHITMALVFKSSISVTLAMVMATLLPNYRVSVDMQNGFQHIRNSVTSNSCTSPNCH